MKAPHEPRGTTATRDRATRKARPRRRVTPWRWALALSVLAVWSGGAILVGREGGTGLALTAGVLFTLPLCSLGEWLVHGLLYHGRVPGLGIIRTIHHHGHHFAVFPPRRYVHEGPSRFMHFRAPLLPLRLAEKPIDDFLSMYSQVALHFVVGIPLVLVPAWLLTDRGAFVGSVAVTLTIISWLLGYVHGAIHTPRGRPIERMRWFQWLNHHHYIHHIDLRSNLNFMLPIFDALLGTQKGALTPGEAAAFPTFAEATQSPLRVDRPSREPRSARPAETSAEAGA